MNNITDGLNGITIGTGSYNIIYGNNVTGNFFSGISIIEGFNNIISENHIENNQYGAIIGGHRQEAGNNTLYRNNFINNTYQVRTELTYYGWIGGKEISWNVHYCTINNWDNGKEGNYWSDYNGVDINNDGIGDTPYIICEHNKDNYPLVEAILITTPSDEENLTPPPSEPSPLQQHDFLGTSLPLEIGYALLAVIATAVVATFFRVYFKKLRKNTNPSCTKLKQCCNTWLW